MSNRAVAVAWGSPQTKTSLAALVLDNNTMTCSRCHKSYSGSLVLTFVTMASQVCPMMAWIVEVVNIRRPCWWRRPFNRADTCRDLAGALPTSLGRHPMSTRSDFVAPRGGIVFHPGGATYISKGFFRCIVSSEGRSTITANCDCEKAPGLLKVIW